MTPQVVVSSGLIPYEPDVVDQYFEKPTRRLPRLRLTSITRRSLENLGYSRKSPALGRANLIEVAATLRLTQNRDEADLIRAWAVRVPLLTFAIIARTATQISVSSVVLSAGR